MLEALVLDVKRVALVLAALLAAGAVAYGGARIIGGDDAEVARSPGGTSPTATADAGERSRPAAHPVSLPAYMEKRFDGDGLKLDRVLARNSAYTRYHVTYRGGGLTISGIMNIPSGAGPFPLLILAHGYIDPDVYVNGQGLRREQDYLARRGYAVLHTDYRNHAQSDDDPNHDLHLRLGYAEDAINAALAVQRARLPQVDGDRIGIVGRSMGGAVTYNAAILRPDLFDAAVVFAPISSNAVENFDRWIRRSGERRALADQIERRYGSPEDDPQFWRNISAVNFFDRIAAPVMIHHGTADDTCPIRWSRDTHAALRAAGKASTLYTYDGEGHAFGPQWTTAMRRTVTFLDAHVKRS